MRVEAGAASASSISEGGQVGDLFAFCLDDLGEYLSAEHTRAELFRLFPRVGESFVSNRRRPILLFEADTSPGFHDMLFAACDAARYASSALRPAMHRAPATSRPRWPGSASARSRCPSR